MPGNEFDFSDDELDFLPADALVELENNAIQFTQAQSQARYSKPANTVKAAPSSDYGDEIGEEDLDDAVIIDESKSTPAIIPGFQYQRPAPAQAVQREQFRQQRYGGTNNTYTALADRQRNPPIPPPPRVSQPTRVPPRAPILQNDSMTAEQGSQPSVSGDNNAEELQRQFQEVRNCHRNMPNILTVESYSRNGTL
jgi:hypothetical protein